jgi:hypothetical protein
VSVRNKIKRLLLRDGYHCWLCNQIMSPDLPYDDPMVASIDHYVQRGLGGRNTDENCKRAASGYVLWRPRGSRSPLLPRSPAALH